MAIYMIILSKTMFNTDSAVFVLESQTLVVICTGFWRLYQNIERQRYKCGNIYANPVQKTKQKVTKNLPMVSSVNA